MSSTQILAAVGDVNVSFRTIQRRLVDFGLPARKPAKKPFLSKKNRDARMLFARFHQNWTTHDWKKVLFSDESKFLIFSNEKRQFVRRPAGKRLDPKYVATTAKQGGGNIMVWGSISAYGIGPI